MKRRLIVSISFWVASILILSTSMAFAQAPRITVMNPAIVDKLAERVSLSPRPDTLEGKTVYIIDTNYEGFGRLPVLEEMQAWFAKNMPGVKTVFRLKKGNYVEDDPALWKEIAASKASGVVIGVAG